jgi:hypothetical protein
MVSPPDKHGGFIEPISAPGGAIQASEDGSALAYVVDGPLVEDPEGNRSPELQQILATRGSSEWASQEIVAPHERAFGLRAGRPPEYQAFSADLSLSLLQPFPYGLTPAQEPSLSPRAPGKNDLPTQRCPNFAERLGGDDLRRSQAERRSAGERTRRSRSQARISSAHHGRKRGAGRKVRR